MEKIDLILDGSREPSDEELLGYMDNPVKKLWKGINDFIQEKYKTSPKMAYSKCSGKPGWNRKYKKSGKSLCTLYPEKGGFVALIVILQDSLPVVEAMYPDFEKEVVDVITSAQPLNGTFWLMVPVKNSRALENVKDLLVLKHNPEKYSKRK